jgi:8-oxo-dGTP pyrophosphatase MutT (NUDIX family)
VARAPRQAAAIPFRRTRTGVSLCLITSKASDLWGIPKGTIAPGFTAEQAALQEALEEAGLEGRIEGACVGEYQYPKAGELLTVAVYLMDVELEAAEWEEQDVRRRRWVPVAEALRLLEAHPAHGLVARACERLAP